MYSITRVGRFVMYADTSMWEILSSESRVALLSGISSRKSLQAANERADMPIVNIFNIFVFI